MRVINHEFKIHPRQGFTLIELLVVIIVVALLSAGIYAATLSQPDKARDAARVANLQQIKDGLDLYYQDNNFYPTTAGFMSSSSWKDASGNTVYLQKVPKDPSNPYLYVTDSTSTTPQWAIVYASLSKPQANPACKLPDYVVNGGCVPGINSTNINSYGCVVLGNITCAAPTPTVVTPTSGPTPTSLPTPTPGAAPTPPPGGTNLAQDADHDGYYTGGVGPQVTTGSSVINGRTYYKTAQTSGSSNPYIFIVATSALGGNDCDDTNANVYQSLAASSIDADHDGYYTGGLITSCVGPTSVSSETGNLVDYLPMNEGGGTTLYDNSGFGNNAKFGSAYSFAGWWKMDEGAGAATLSDSSGNNFTATNVGGATTGASGTNSSNAVSLNGNNQYLQINDPTGASALDPTHQVTITGWFKANNLNKPVGWQNIFFKGTAYAGGWVNRQYSMFLQNTGVLYVASTPQGSNTQIGCYGIIGSISPGQWYNFAVVINSDTSSISIYLNGILQNSSGLPSCDPYLANGTTASTISTNAGSFYIGDDIEYGPGNDYALNGSVDDFRVYGRALSQPEIQTMYSTSTSGLSGYWPFDQGFGDISGNGNNGSFVDTSLNAYWALDDSTSTTAVDSSGNNNNGTPTGTTVVNPGRWGYARSFNGSSDKIDIPDSPSLAPASAFSISAWVNPSVNTYGASILNRRRPDNNGSYSFDLGGSNNLILYLWTANSGGTWGAVTTSANVLPNNQWSHVAAVYDGSKAQIYINGVSVGSTNFTGAVNNPAGSLIRMGDNIVSGSYFFNGGIDELRYYNRALTPPEINGLYYGNNSPWVNPGRIGANAVGFYGSSYVDVPTSSTLNLNTFTVSEWVKWNSLTANQVVAEKGALGCGTNWHLIYRNNSLNATVYCANDIPFAANPTIGVWYHYAATYSTVGGITTITTYTNGVQIATGNTTVPLSVPSGSDLMIGANPQNPGCCNLNATVDDFQIYNRILSSTEIAAIAGNIGDPIWVTGHGASTNPAISLNGLSDFAAAPDQTSLRVSNKQSISAWVNWSGQGNGCQRIVGKGTTNRNYGLWMCPSIWLFQVNSNNGAQWCNVASSVPATTGWNYLVGVYDGNNINLYVNGNPATPVSCNITPSTSTEPLMIGSFVGSYPNSFNGVIDDVRVYSRVLSQAEITQLMGNSTSGQAAFWKFEEATGQGVVDSTGNGNNGVANGTTIVTGRPPARGQPQGLARSFNGTTDYIKVASNPSLNFPGGNFTLSTWVNPTSNSGQTVINKGNGSSADEEYILEIGAIGTPGKISFFYKGAWYESTTAPVVTGSGWHNISVVVGNGSTITFYYDGNQTGLVVNVPSGTYGPTLTMELDIGRQGPSCNCHYFSGNIDDTIVYNRALSAAEVSSIYAANPTTGGYGGITKTYYEGSDGSFKAFLQSDAIGSAIDPNDHDPLIWP